MVQFNSVVSES